jgi:hypothetical protein
MNVKRYEVETDGLEPFTVVIDVDHDKLTPEIAKQVNDFWSSADERLAAANGDVTQAVIKDTASFFIQSTLEGFNVYGCNSELDDAEGWPDQSYIKLVSIEGMPVYDSRYYSIREVPKS